MTKSRIFLYPSDLVILTGKTYSTAYRAYQTLLDSVGKGKKKKLTIQEYCQLEDLSEDIVKQALNLN